MSIWLNCKCDNSEGNMCMCPRCRCVREIGENGLLPKHLPVEWLVKFIEWDNRMVQAEEKMKNRFPKENE